VAGSIGFSVNAENKAELLGAGVDDALLDMTELR